MKTILRPLVFTGLLLLFAAGASAQSILSSVDGKRVDLDAQDGKIVVLAVSRMAAAFRKAGGIHKCLGQKVSGTAGCLLFCGHRFDQHQVKEFCQRRRC